MFNRRLFMRVALLTFVIGCLSASEFGLFGNIADIGLTLRLRGGTGQGGPSKGFRSNGKSFKWRHPMTMFGRAHAHRRPPTVSHSTFAIYNIRWVVCCEFSTVHPYVSNFNNSRFRSGARCVLTSLCVLNRLSNTRQHSISTPKTS